ncbi:MAG: non-heme iron oxygenase ferredoxin subunit [Candidatus Kerfeldbacteria bacterium]|nr:non-heme iron oxygenase ferredoxin subunit [Candidatus Kerfeldbacteria bacterium]
MSFVPVCKITDLPEGKKRKFTVNSRDICVYHLSDGFFATDDVCSHAQSSLADGFIVDDHTIECARHGAQFAIRSGTVMSLPAVVPIRTFNVKVENDEVLVEVEPPKPRPGDLPLQPHS